MCGGVSHRTKGSREQGRDSPPTEAEAEAEEEEEVRRRRRRV